MFDVFATREVLSMIDTLFPVFGEIVVSSGNYSKTSAI